MTKQEIEHFAPIIATLDEEIRLEFMNVSDKLDKAIEKEYQIYIDDLNKEYCWASNCLLYGAKIDSTNRIIFKKQNQAISAQNAYFEEYRESWTKGYTVSEKIVEALKKDTYFRKFF